MLPLVPNLVINIDLLTKKDSLLCTDEENNSSPEIYQRYSKIPIVSMLNHIKFRSCSLLGSLF